MGRLVEVVGVIAVAAVFFSGLYYLLLTTTTRKFVVKDRDPYTAIPTKEVVVTKQPESGDKTNG